MTSLFYPALPGAKEHGGASEDAAKAIAAEAGALRAGALAVLTAAGPGGLTADEIAAIMGLDILTIRPRVSELGALGLAVKTGLRRRNARGSSCGIWIAANVAEHVAAS
jgi:hypothetical protein